MQALITVELTYGQTLAYRSKPGLEGTLCMPYTLHIRPTLELKTEPKQLLGLDIVLNKVH
jgi:hypothetical protein